MTLKTKRNHIMTIKYQLPLKLYGPYGVAKIEYEIEEILKTCRLSNQAYFSL